MQVKVKWDTQYTDINQAIPPEIVTIPDDVVSKWHNSEYHPGDEYAVLTDYLANTYDHLVNHLEIC